MEGRLRAALMLYVYVDLAVLPLLVERVYERESQRQRCSVKIGV